MSLRATRHAALVVLAGSAVLAACSGGSDGATDVTLPSSLSIPTTEPGASSSTTSSTPPTTAHGTGTVPIPEGAPRLIEVTAAPGACLGGNVSVVVSFQVAPDPPTRVVTAFLDGSDPVASTTGGPITLPPVPCDGTIRQVQVIATGTGGESSAEAVAFRTPRS